MSGRCRCMLTNMDKLAHAVQLVLLAKLDRAVHHVL